MVELASPLGTRPAGTRLVIGLLLAMTAALASASLMGLAGWFIVKSAQTGLSSTSGFSWLYPSAGVEALAVIRTAARYGERLSTHRSTLELLAQVRTRLFASATRLPMAKLRSLRSGDLLDRVQADVDTLDRYVLAVAVPAVVCTVVGVASLTILTMVRPFFGAAAGGLLIIALATDLAMGQGSRRLGGQLALDRSAARSHLIEAIEGRAELATFGARELAYDELRDRFAALDVPARRLSVRNANGQAVIAIAAGLAVAAILAAGTAGQRPLDSAVLALAALLTLALFDAAKTIGSISQEAGRARAAWHRLRELTGPARAAGRESESSDDRDRAPRRGGPPVAADIVVRGLSAGYGTGPVLELDHLDVPAGSFVILSGHSGAGKTTLLSVLAGEQPVMNGEVHVGGVDPYALNYEERNGYLTLVEADSGVLSGTIEDNLRLARPEATGAELDHALHVVVLSGFLERSTQVGPAGSFLSGGQRRRLALAQAYLRRPRLMLLDEPTEGLDDETAGQILANLRAALPGTTIVAAIHARNAGDMIPQADRVIQLADGRVVADRSGNSLTRSVTQGEDLTHSSSKRPGTRPGAQAAQLG
ncbi:MAG: ATP-binding cassette, subfamily bacterial CydC [Frankiales bacterium]|nr:ATP-binding cassette, subfamily bacterial CydC [Frankiales bacterium]